jgi:peptidoglycan/xylan/chitin deacetylase (PgdA/CDA1 family)
MAIHPVWLTAGGICAAGGIFAWAAVAPSSQIFGNTVRRLSDASAIALTFDDGPNPAITPRLLNLLDRYAAKASFFLIGRHVRAFPKLAKEIADRGHAIGNHTETHPALTFLSARRIAEEIGLCDEAIFEASGKRSECMRTPYGYRSPLLDGIIRRRAGGRVVMWSAMAWDWKPQPAVRVIKHLFRVRGGDIVLLHDGDHRVAGGDRQHTLGALGYWLPRWSDAGLRCVSLDEIL